MVSKVEIARHANNVVGESIIWDDRKNCLLWVDIVSKTIQRFVPDTGEFATFPTPDFVTSIGLREDGDYVVGLRKEIVIWDGMSTFRPFAAIEPEQPENRLNEGVVGPDGHFWVGTMQNNIAEDGAPMDMTASTGRLYRVSPKGDIQLVCEDVFGITNTLVWTDNGRLVTADTLKNEIYSYAMAPNGQLSDRMKIVSGCERGVPDGSCGDADGNIINCRVAGGSCLLKFAPDGSILDVIEIPCSWPTSCTFGGANLDVLYVTSARFTMSDEHLAAAPQEGALMAVKTGSTGQPGHRMK